jgi:hypothetical protein
MTTTARKQKNKNRNRPGCNTLSVHNVPDDARAAFKAWCAVNKTTMEDAIIAFLKSKSAVKGA